MKSLYRMLIAGLGAATVLAACQSPSVAPPATDAPLLPTDPPVVSSPTLEDPTQVSVPPGMAADSTPFEIAAATSGKQPYSGYECQLAADGCTCDRPVILSAEFVFQPGEQMTYHFSGDTYKAEWAMNRIAPGQWSYTIVRGADAGGTGSYFYLLEFTEEGYTLTQREDLGEGQVLTCPAVAFTRMGQ